MSFEKYMSEEVLMPLGMEHSSFANDFTDANMSKSYGFFGQALPNYNYTEKSAAGLKTTVLLRKFSIFNTLWIFNDNVLNYNLEYSLIYI